MSTVEITKRMVEGSPGIRTKAVVAYYLLSVLTGTLFFFIHGRFAFAADLVAAVFYLAATALLYVLSGRRNEGGHVKKEDRL